jgi:hypothetical protein
MDTGWPGDGIEARRMPSPVWYNIGITSVVPTGVARRPAAIGRQSLTDSQVRNRAGGRGHVRSDADSRDPSCDLRARLQRAAGGGGDIARYPGGALPQARRRVQLYRERRACLPRGTHRHRTLGTAAIDATSRGHPAPGGRRRDCLLDRSSGARPGPPGRTRQRSRSRRRGHRIRDRAARQLTGGGTDPFRPRVRCEGRAREAA